MRVLERFVILGPQLVRILSSSPSTSSCSGHPTKDVHPEPAEGLFSHSELSATGCRPAALCVLLTPLAASLTQKPGGTGYWSYQILGIEERAGPFGRTQGRRARPLQRRSGHQLRITTHLLLLHYPCSRIELRASRYRKVSYANSLHPMDRRAEIPRRQSIRPRAAVRFRSRIQQGSRGHGDGADGARLLHRHGHGPDPRKKAPEARVARSPLLRRARRRAAHRVDQARSPVPPARHAGRSRRSARHVPYRGKILFRRRHAEKNRRLHLALRNSSHRGGKISAMSQLSEKFRARLFPANHIIYNQSFPLAASFLQGETWLAANPQKSRLYPVTFLPPPRPTPLCKKW